MRGLHGQPWGASGTLQPAAGLKPPSAAVGIRGKPPHCIHLGPSRLVPNVVTIAEAEPMAAPGRWAVPGLQAHLP